MSDVLGYDCDGKPVRVGDMVEVVRTDARWADKLGAVCRVLGPGYRPDFVSIDLSAFHGLKHNTLPSGLRVINDNTGSWDHIEQILQWQRTKVEEVAA
ncbi:MAG: hypothetical protein AAGI72_15395 [Pseudomonadota bacterium]